MSCPRDERCAGERCRLLLLLLLLAGGCERERSLMIVVRQRSHRRNKSRLGQIRQRPRQRKTLSLLRPSRPTANEAT